MIASLVDKSLVTATGEAEVRYRLLETVRAYAAERLAEAGEAEQVRAAHAAYFLDLAEQGEPQLRGPDQLGWLARLSAEHDNFAAALRYVIDARDAESGLRFVAALAWFWVMRDYETEAGEWATAVRDIATEPVRAARPGRRVRAVPHPGRDRDRGPGRGPAARRCCWTRCAACRPWSVTTPAIRCWCWPSRCWRYFSGDLERHAAETAGCSGTTPIRGCGRPGTRSAGT